MSARSGWRLGGRWGTAQGLGNAFLFPRPVEGVPVYCTAGAPLLAPGQPATLLAWNIQFAAGRSQAFFYDYGDAVSVPHANVDAVLMGIAEVIRAVDPDFVLLQEVDRHARRTGFVDQHARLLADLGYPCHATTAYWRAPYVPFPRHHHLGPVNMHLTVMSRYALAGATRRALPLLRESPWRRPFNVKRAVLEVEVPLDGGGRLVLLDAHLSAFSRGDGTLGRQVAILDRRAAALEAGRVPWIIGGDFNALAPGDDVTRLAPYDRQFYQERVTPVTPLIEHYRDPVGDGWHRDPQRWRTFLPFGADVPDRTLDYVIHGSAVQCLDYQVLQDDPRWSDHLPLILTFATRP